MAKDKSKIIQELMLEQVDRLRKMRLPASWKVAKLDVHFEREGYLGDYASVVYDSMNNCFYVKTNKAIVYQGDKKALVEAISIMDEANRIIK
jgi:hypothetical protein